MTVAYHRRAREQIFGADRVEPAIFFIACSPTRTWSNIALSRAMLQPATNR